MKIIIEIFLLAVLIFYASGCASLISQSELESGIIAMGKLMATEICSVTIPCFAFYAKNNCWPNTIDELRSFLKANPEGIEELKKKEGSFETEIFPLDYSRFDNAEFETLPNGDLKITLQEYTYENGLTTGKMSLTLSPKRVAENVLQ